MAGAPAHVLRERLPYAELRVEHCVDDRRVPAAKQHVSSIQLISLVLMFE